MGIMAQSSILANNAWSSDRNWAILVPFNSSYHDESNGTKIVQFRSLDHVISLIKK